MLRSYGWALVVVWLLFACAATVLSAYKIGTYPLEEKKSALVTPLFVFAATVVLSICVYQTFSGALDARGLVQLVVMLSVLLKGLGVLYLTTKEMAYIPLRATTRVYAKGTLEFAGFALYTLVVTTFPVTIGTGEGYNYPILLLFVASAVWCTAVVILSKVMRSGTSTCKVRVKDLRA